MGRAGIGLSATRERSALAVDAIKYVCILSAYHPERSTEINNLLMGHRAFVAVGSEKVKWERVLLPPKHLQDGASFPETCDKMGSKR